MCDDEERKKSSKVDAINLRWCQGEVSRKGGGREGGERAKERKREKDGLRRERERQRQREGERESATNGFYILS